MVNRHNYQRRYHHQPQGGGLSPKSSSAARSLPSSSLSYLHSRDGPSPSSPSSAQLRARYGTNVAAKSTTMDDRIGVVGGIASIQTSYFSTADLPPTEPTSSPARMRRGWGGGDGVVGDAGSGWRSGMDRFEGRESYSYHRQRGGGVDVGVDYEGDYNHDGDDRYDDDVTERTEEDEDILHYSSHPVITPPNNDFQRQYRHQRPNSTSVSVAVAGVNKLLSPRRTVSVPPSPEGLRRSEIMNAGVAGSERSVDSEDYEAEMIRLRQQRRRFDSSPRVARDRDADRRSALGLDEHNPREVDGHGRGRYVRGGAGAGAGIGIDGGGERVLQGSGKTAGEEETRGGREGLIARGGGGGGDDDSYSRGVLERLGAVVDSRAGGGGATGRFNSSSPSFSGRQFYNDRRMDEEKEDAITGGKERLARGVAMFGIKDGREATATATKTASPLRDDASYSRAVLERLGFESGGGGGAVSRRDGEGGGGGFMTSKKIATVADPTPYTNVQEVAIGVKTRRFGEEEDEQRGGSMDRYGYGHPRLGRRSLFPLSQQSHDNDDDNDVAAAATAASTTSTSLLRGTLFRRKEYHPPFSERGVRNEATNGQSERIVGGFIAAKEGGWDGGGWKGDSPTIITVSSLGVPSVMDVINEEEQLDDTTASESVRYASDAVDIKGARWDLRQQQKDEEEEFRGDTTPRVRGSDAYLAAATTVQVETAVESRPVSAVDGENDGIRVYPTAASSVSVAEKGEGYDDGIRISTSATTRSSVGSSISSVASRSGGSRALSSSVTIDDGCDGVAASSIVERDVNVSSSLVLLPPPNAEETCAKRLDDTGRGHQRRESSANTSASSSSVAANVNVNVNVNTESRNIATESRMESDIGADDDCVRFSSTSAAGCDDGSRVSLATSFNGGDGKCVPVAATDADGIRVMAYPNDIASSANDHDGSSIEKENFEDDSALEAAYSTVPNVTNTQLPAKDEVTAAANETSPELQNDLSKVSELSAADKDSKRRSSVKVKVDGLLDYMSDTLSPKSEASERKKRKKSRRKKSKNAEDDSHKEKDSANKSSSKKKKSRKDKKKEKSRREEERLQVDSVDLEAAEPSEKLFVKYNSSSESNPTVEETEECVEKTHLRKETTERSFEEGAAVTMSVWMSDRDTLILPSKGDVESFAAARAATVATAAASVLEDEEMNNGEGRESEHPLNHLPTSSSMQLDDWSIRSAISSVSGVLEREAAYITRDDRQASASMARSAVVAVDEETILSFSSVRCRVREIMMDAEQTIEQSSTASDTRQEEESDSRRNKNYQCNDVPDGSAAFWSRCAIRAASAVLQSCSGYLAADRERLAHAASEAVFRSCLMSGAIAISGEADEIWKLSALDLLGDAAARASLAVTMAGGEEATASAAATAILGERRMLLVDMNTNGRDERDNREPNFELSGNDDTLSTENELRDEQKYGNKFEGASSLKGGNTQHQGYAMIPCTAVPGGLLPGHLELPPLDHHGQSVPVEMDGTAYRSIGEFYHDTHVNMAAESGDEDRPSEFAKGNGVYHSKYQVEGIESANNAIQEEATTVSALDEALAVSAKESEHESFAEETPVANSLNEVLGAADTGEESGDGDREQEISLNTVECLKGEKVFSKDIEMNTSSTNSLDDEFGTVSDDLKEKDIQPLGFDSGIIEAAATSPLPIGTIERSQRHVKWATECLHVPHVHTEQSELTIDSGADTVKIENLRRTQGVWPNHPLTSRPRHGLPSGRNRGVESDDLVQQMRNIIEQQEEEVVHHGVAPAALPSLRKRINKIHRRAAKNVKKLKAKNRWSKQSSPMVTHLTTVAEDVTTEEENTYTDDECNTLEEDIVMQEETSFEDNRLEERKLLERNSGESEDNADLPTFANKIEAHGSRITIDVGAMTQTNVENCTKALVVIQKSEVKENLHAATEERIDGNPNESREIPYVCSDEFLNDLKEFKKDFQLFDEKTSAEDPESSVQNDRDEAHSENVEDKTDAVEEFRNWANGAYFMAFEEEGMEVIFMDVGFAGDEHIEFVDGQFLSELAFMGKVDKDENTIVLDMRNTSEGSGEDEFSLNNCIVDKKEERFGEDNAAKCINEEGKSHEETTEEIQCDGSRLPIDQNLGCYEENRDGGFKSLTDSSDQDEKIFEGLSGETEEVQAFSLPVDEYKEGKDEQLSKPSDNDITVTSSLANSDDASSYSGTNTNKNDATLVMKVEKDAAEIQEPSKSVENISVTRSLANSDDASSYSGPNTDRNDATLVVKVEKDAAEIQEPFQFEQQMDLTEEEKRLDDSRPPHNGFFKGPKIENACEDHPNEGITEEERTLLKAKTNSLRSFKPEQRKGNEATAQEKELCQERPKMTQQMTSTEEKKRLNDSLPQHNGVIKDLKIENAREDRSYEGTTNQRGSIKMKEERSLSGAKTNSLRSFEPQARNNCEAKAQEKEHFRNRPEMTKQKSILKKSFRKIFGSKKQSNKGNMDQSKRKEASAQAKRDVKAAKKEAIESEKGAKVKHPPTTFKISEVQSNIVGDLSSDDQKNINHAIMRESNMDHLGKKSGKGSNALEKAAEVEHPPTVIKVSEEESDIVGNISFSGQQSKDLVKMQKFKMDYPGKTLPNIETEEQSEHKEGKVLSLSLAATNTSFDIRRKMVLENLEENTEEMCNNSKESKANVEVSPVPSTESMPVIECDDSSIEVDLGSSQVNFSDEYEENAFSLSKKEATQR